MTKLWIIILSALGMGFVTGVFLYVVNTDIQKETKQKEVFEFEIIGDAYGGCLLNSSCPSFRIVSSGEYTYVSGVKNKDGDNLFKGDISEKELSTLKQILKNFNPDFIRESRGGKTCNSFVDGIDYEYFVTNGDNHFSIDTCQNEGKGVSGLFEEFSNYWVEFSVTHLK